MDMKYAVIIEEGPSSYGAYVPDLPGCVAVADSRAEVLDLIREAVEVHLAELRQQGSAIPAPVSSAELVEVAA
jgi:predicted RNase H-like HicB family nuclease